jgi:hypothetical protein
MICLIGREMHAIVESRTLDGGLPRFFVCAGVVELEPSFGVKTVESP